MPVTPASRRWKQAHQDFKVILSYLRYRVFEVSPGCVELSQRKKKMFWEKAEEIGVPHLETGCFTGSLG